MTTRTAPKGGLLESVNLPHSAPLELYNNSFSSCSQKVRLCLAEAGQTYKSNHIHLIETGWYQTCSPDFKKINPGATVPVLVHNGHPVYESHEQIHYIDKHFLNNSLAPPALDAEVHEWTEFVSIKGDPMSDESQETHLGSCTVALTLPIFASMVQDISVGKILWGLIHHPNKERPIIFLVLKMLGPFAVQLPPVLALIRKGRTRSKKHLEKLEKHLSDGRPFVCGEKYTLGDVGLTAALNRIDNADFSFIIADLPNVSKYWERLRSRDSFNEAIKKSELPIMTMAFARIKLWKDTHTWFKDALETDKPVASTFLRRAVFQSALVITFALLFKYMTK